MKKTIYIINAILFIGSCLLVTTTDAVIEKNGIDNKITYVNSSEIRQENITPVSVVPVEVNNVENKEEVEKIVDSKYEVQKETETKNVNKVVKDDNIEDNTSINTDSNSSVNSNDKPVSNNNDTSSNTNADSNVFTGKMSGYGADIGDFTASGYYIKDTITYYDSAYGEVRILAGDYSFPFGTIVRVSNTNVGNFIGIVLDRGPDIGLNGKFTFDLLFKTSNEAWNYGVSSNAKFEILRRGF